MKLYFMKQAALDNLKVNLPTACQNYFTEDNSGWIKEFCNDEKPFEEYKTVADFELATEGDEGKIDFENCKILYQNLKFLTEVQASDERFWAGLTHSEFYNFVRVRYNYNSGEIKKESVASIQRNFFFHEGTKVGNITNALAKCWWMARLLYDEKNSNPFWKLDALGAAAFTSKIYRILRLSFSANPTILSGIVKFFAQFPNLAREDWTAALQHLNKIGGNVILDYLSEDEIAKILIDYTHKFTAKVEFGDVVETISLLDSKINKFFAGSYKVYTTAKDKKIGETFAYNGKNYKITDIIRSNINGGSNL
ncbi:MAG: hypothetical protein IJT73_05140 [Selenomonadaceae bacterium]|nr:hypothetical protein [Selenomonadaceae bacterium]